MDMSDMPKLYEQLKHDNIMMSLGRAFQ